VPVLPTASPGPESEDDLLDAAFELAFFIHQDRPIALAICRDAMQKLEVAASAQAKRLYYQPRKRSGEGQGRSRASWGDRHLLQRLIYFESEAWERQGEIRDPDSLTEDDLLLRFLKHLCRITMKRNSFYASIALGRIVHAYSTADTMGLYDAIAPEGCERKQSDYFRSRKAQLLDEVRGRFGDLLSIIRGPHQEDRIETREATAAAAAWARECLRVLTPWATPCWEKEEKPTGKRRRHRFAREQDEDSQEARRFHALFHPPCFSGLTRFLRLADPGARLAIPRFHVGGRPPGQGGGGRDDRSARLSAEERAEIQRQLAEESRRRREFPTRFLRVLVDGQERVRIDPRASSVARLSLEATAEVIEVRATIPEGEMLLAVHALTGAAEGEETGPEVFSIVLESGQSLSFRVGNSAGLAGERSVELDYRETGPLRATLLGARRAAYRAVGAAGFAAGWVEQPIAALLLLGAIGLALQFGRTQANRAPARRTIAAAVAARSEPRAELPSPAPPLSAPSIDRPVAAAAALARSARSNRPSTTLIANARPRRDLPAEGSLAKAHLRETTRSLSPVPIFSAERTPLLEGERIAASRSDLGALVRGVNAKTALEAVRRSFVDSLGSETPHSSSSGRTDGLPVAAAVSFAGASTQERGGVARGDSRVAAFWADVSARSLASETADSLESRLLPPNPDPSPRVSVLRSIGAPGQPATAYCRQGELACSVARISPASRSARQARVD
jgi:hypothetical protein